MQQYINKKFFGILFTVFCFSIPINSSAYALSEEECSESIEKLRSGEISKEEAEKIMAECGEPSFNGERPVGKCPEDKKVDGKCPSEERPVGKCPEDKKVDGKCPAEERQVGKCPEDNCPTKEMKNCPEDKKVDGKCPAEERENHLSQKYPEEHKKSPRQQMKDGVNASDVSCNEDRVLVIKTSTEKALCVSSTSVEKLIERGIIYLP